jgi:anti-anti-sigma regulatory factor
MSFRIAEKQGPGDILMGGRLTVENAAGIREALVSVFQQSGRIAIALEGDVVADLSFLQVLCAAYQTALREDKIFEFDSSAAPEVHALMQETGFVYDRRSFCDPDVRREESGRGDNG